MSDKIRNDFADYGLEILKRSVLLVLYQQPLDSGGQHRRYLRQDAIRKQLNIRKPPYEPNRLIRGILDILQEDKYVEYRYEGFWRIKEKGVSFIED